MMRNFVAVMNIPSPYRLHSLGEWGRQLKERGYDFHCHFMARGHKDRPKSWLNPQIDFQHTYWADWGFGEYHFNPGLVWKLVCNPPDVLHVGSSYDTFTGILLALFCRAKIISIGLEGNTKTPGRIHGIWGKFKRLILSKGHYATVPGAEGVGYIALHQALTLRKMPQPAVFPNLVDEKRFDRTRFSKSECLGVRHDLFAASDNEKVCLIPARFDPVKGLKEFFSALEPAYLKGWRLVVMGHGPEESQTMKIVSERGLSAFVQVVHSVPYDEMPKCYAAADLMLLPSRQDMNPLCVVEALHTGLPIALSEQAGNVEEAVTDGVNGWRLPVLDKVQYAAKLRDVFSASEETLLAMGRKSKEINARFWDSQSSTAKWLDQLLAGLE